MSKETWTAVDTYLAATIAPSDDALDAALEASARAGLPAIHVSPPQGRFLMLLARACGARRILEIGTLGAYSTIWLARALPREGRLVTLESEPRHAEVARSNLVRAGLDAIVEIRLGRAAETLAALVQAGGAPFDFIFIDADKVGYPEYLRRALELSRPGTVIVADNVVRNGAVADPASTDASVQAVRRMNEIIAAERRLDATVLQTVGSKGYDGFAMMIVRDDSGIA